MTMIKINTLAEIKYGLIDNLVCDEVDFFKFHI